MRRPSLGAPGWMILSWLNTSLDEHGVVRSTAVFVWTLFTLAVIGCLISVLVWAAVPAVLLWASGGVAVAMCGVLGLLATGRELAGRVMFLVVGYAGIGAMAVMLGPEAHNQYFLVPGIGLPFLFIGPERPLVRWGMSLVALPIGAGVVAAQLWWPPLVAVAPAELSVIGVVNDAMTLLTAGLMYALFTRQADAQIARAQEQQRALVASAAQLQQANAELDGFARVVSHDLKTPLGGIVGLVALMKLDGHSLPDSQRELLDLIDQTAQSMDELIGGVLQRARAAHETTRERVDLDHLVAQILRETPSRGLRVVFEGGCGAVHTHRIALRQVLANLISNALKYHDKPDGTVWISARVAGGGLDIEVRDDGPGIPRALHEEVFSLYGTAHQQERADSTGVGLATVKKLVEQAGGTISLRSELGHGACFRVRWPLELTDPVRLRA